MPPAGFIRRSIHHDAAVSEPQLPPTFSAAKTAKRANPHANIRICPSFWHVSSPCLQAKVVKSCSCKRLTPHLVLCCLFNHNILRFIGLLISWSERKQPSFQSLLNLLISHNRSKQRFFLNCHIPINSCCFSVDWSINWCKWCRSFYPRSRNATYSLDTLLYSLLKYESRPSNSDCLSSFVTSV